MQRCERVAPVHSRRGGEAVCSTCAHHPQRICTRCRYPRPHRSPDPGCSRCGTSSAVRCAVCGDDRFAFRVGAHGCLRCRLHHHVDRLSDGADPTRTALLRPFLDGLRQSEDPRAALDWISKRRTARAVITEMLHATAPVSHETLDQAGARACVTSTSVEYLRQLLVDSQVLPARHEPLSRVERTIDRRLATCSGRPRQSCAATPPSVLPGLRRPHRSPPSPRSAAAALATFVTAQAFCTWLGTQGADLTRLNQGLVDTWVAEHRHHADRLATFTTWAARQHLTPTVHVERRPSSYPSNFAPADDQLAGARICLTDDTVPAQDRLAGALLLLYGQPLSRIARLRRGDLELAAADEVFVRLGPTPLALPGPLTRIARQVARETPPVPGISRGFVADSPWLFPGRPSSRPIDPPLASPTAEPQVPHPARTRRAQHRPAQPGSRRATRRPRRPPRSLDRDRRAVAPPRQRAMIHLPLATPSDIQTLKAVLSYDLVLRPCPTTLSYDLVLRHWAWFAANGKGWCQAFRCARSTAAPTEAAVLSASERAAPDSASPGDTTTPDEHRAAAARPAGRDEDWLAQVAGMNEAELRSLAASLPLIEQAKGVLMAYYGCNADRAFAILRRWSSVHHVKIRELAALLVAHTEAEPPSRADTDGPAGQWRPFHAIQTFFEQTGLN